MQYGASSVVSSLTHALVNFFHCSLFPFLKKHLNDRPSKYMQCVDYPLP